MAFGKVLHFVLLTWQSPMLIAVKLIGESIARCWKLDVELQMWFLAERNTIEETHACIGNAFRRSSPLLFNMNNKHMWLVSTFLFKLNHILWIFNARCPVDVFHHLVWIMGRVKILAWKGLVTSVFVLTGGWETSVRTGPVSRQNIPCNPRSRHGSVVNNHLTFTLWIC